MGDVLKIDLMSLRDEKIGKVWFWARTNCQKSTTLCNSWPLYMAIKNIFLFYFIKIFYVSNIAILKCPSMTSQQLKKVCIVVNILCNFLHISVTCVTPRTVDFKN